MWKYLLVLCLFIVPLAYGEDDYGGYLYPTLAAAEPCDCQVTGVCTCGYCQCEKPIQLVSVSRKRDIDYANLLKAPSSLGYGSPNDKAPIPDSFGTLVSLQGDGGYALIDEHHQAPPATRKIPADNPATLQSASPRTQTAQYRRVYIGMSCGANGCQPQYRWEPVPTTPVSYTPPAHEYPVYDSIGGVAPQTYSYSYGSGCAGQSGCSGASSSGCAGASGGFRVFRPIRSLFSRRR